MKVKRNINRVAIIVALNLSLTLMTGCMSPVSDKNLSSSEQISKDLKKLGFKFVGSTIIYAYMQAIGIVNDHVKGCHLYANK